MKKAFLILAFCAAAAAALLLSLRTGSGRRAPAPSPEEPALVLFNVSGAVSFGNTGTVVLTSEKGYRYVLAGPLAGEMTRFRGKRIEVLGKIVPPPATLSSDDPSLKGIINVITFGNGAVLAGTSMTPINENLLDILEGKIEKKRELHLALMEKRGNRDEVFDAARGKLSLEMRTIAGGGKKEHLTLASDDGDLYLISGKAAEGLAGRYAELNGRSIVIVGKETVPDGNLTLKAGEVPFEVREAYSEDLTKRL